MIDLEFIRKARNADLLDYLHSQGYRLVKSSPREYRLLDHDSLVISNNRWHWFSRDTGGNTLDFLIKYEGKSFNDAVGILTGKELGAFTAKTRDIFIALDYTESKNSSAAELVLPSKAKDYHRVFASSKFMQELKLKGYIVTEAFSDGKDYNDDLVKLTKPKTLEFMR